MFSLHGGEPGRRQPARVLLSSRPAGGSIWPAYLVNSLKAAFTFKVQNVDLNDYV